MPSPSRGGQGDAWPPLIMELNWILKDNQHSLVLCLETTFLRGLSVYTVWSGEDFKSQESFFCFPTNNMHLKCIFFPLWASPTFPSLLFMSWMISLTCPNMMTLFCNSYNALLQKHGPDHRNPQGGRGYDGGSDVSRKDTDVQACIKPEVLLVFYAHCEPHCRNSVLADSVKCIPEVYWFFTPLQKRCVLCVPKVVWDTYRYFKGPPRESQRLRHKDTGAR